MKLTSESARAPFAPGHALAAHAPRSTRGASSARAPVCPRPLATAAGRAARAALACLALAACAAKPLPPTAQAPVPQQYASGPQSTPEQIDIRVLVVSFKGARMAGDQQRTREDARTRAAMLADMARGGEKLAELIPTYSDRPGAKENLGGLRLRTSPPDEGRADLVAAALRLSTGGISAPIETEEGFVVLERLKDPPAGPERIAAKHILIAYAGSNKPIAGATRSEAEARELAAQVLREVRAQGANWDAIAAKYTDEPGSKTTGGDLGKFGRGAMVPQFERVAFALKVGEISDVVKSPFGFHVIRRYE